MRQNNLTVAVTGGIGSGKSCVLKIIKEVGYPTFSCDEIYAELLNDKTFLSGIESEFKGVVKDRRLDRQKLARMAFASRENLNRLNSITHPRIMEEALMRSSEFKLAFLEVPLLFEEGLQNLFGGVIVVLRDLQSRILSVTQRDKIGKKEALDRINSQFNYDNFDFAEYYVIHNNSNLSDLRQKTLELLKEIEKENL